MSTKKRTSAPKLTVLILANVLLVSGCGESGDAELRQWMDEVRRTTPASVAKIPEPATFTPFRYRGAGELSPYDPAKLQTALARQSAESGVQPDLERRKEPLESFPLDTITMVGTLQRPGLTYALLRVDRNVYQVRVGNYVGQNFGRVTRITETEVHLREIVRDASGEWVEREAKLELQESER